MRHDDQRVEGGPQAQTQEWRIGEDILPPICWGQRRHERVKQSERDERQRRGQANRLAPRAIHSRHPRRDQKREPRHRVVQPSVELVLIIDHGDFEPEVVVRRKERDPLGQDAQLRDREVPSPWKTDRGGASPCV